MAWSSFVTTEIKGLVCYDYQQGATYWDHLSQDLLSSMWSDAQYSGQ